MILILFHLEKRYLLADNFLIISKKITSSIINYLLDPMKKRHATVRSG